MKSFARVILAALFIVSLPCPGTAQSKSPHASPIPKLVQKDGRYALFVDGAPYFILGVQTNNSSDWPSTMPQVWPAVEYVHANTLEIPIYWEQFEPQPGHFDYSQVDLILAQARAHHVHLILLWFGTWKNGSQHYMPDWMKVQPAKYAHVTDRNGELLDSPSPFAAASLDADVRAYTTFMRHLKEIDSERTVLMVQVENEAGTWGSLRDYSPEADKAFHSPVPTEIIRAMGKMPGAGSADWADTFGKDADVYFHAWAIATYVGKMAAAGKAVYPLPTYVNAALRDPFNGAPGTYESGGPTDNVLPIWKAAASSIDILAPDIYLPETASYLKVLELYHRADNALLIPETSGTPRSARFLFSALGMQAIGYSPFGLDHVGTRRVRPGEPASPNGFLDPTAWNYLLLAPMMRDIARLNFEGKLQAVAEEEGRVSQTLHFGAWDAVVSYGARQGNAPTGNPEPVGRALVAQLKDGQYLVTGYDCRVDFRPAATPQQLAAGQVENGTGQIPSARIEGKWYHRQFLRVEEGAYENGSFKFQRILNGDQTDWGLGFGSAPQVLRVSLSTY